MLKPNSQVRLQVAPEHGAFVDAAILRFGYLYPAVETRRGDGEVLLSGGNESALAEAAKQLRYTLYREALLLRYEETRIAMYRGLFK